MIIFCVFGCGIKNTSVESPTIETKKDIPIITKSENPIGPSMPMGLPLWEDIPAPVDLYKPFAALALSSDYTKCYKEWFQGDSLPPNVRKYQGRILEEKEGTIGRLIQCPIEKKNQLLNDLEITSP